MNQATVFALVTMALLVWFDSTDAGLLHRKKHRHNHGPVTYGPQYGYPGPAFLGTPNYGISHDMVHPPHNSHYPVVQQHLAQPGHSSASASASTSNSAASTTPGNGVGHTLQYAVPMGHNQQHHQHQHHGKHGLAKRLLRGHRRHDPYHNAAPFGGYPQNMHY